MENEELNMKEIIIPQKDLLLLSVAKCPKFEYNGRLFKIESITIQNNHQKAFALKDLNECTYAGMLTGMCEVNVELFDDKTGNKYYGISTKDSILLHSCRSNERKENK